MSVKVFLQEQLSIQKTMDRLTRNMVAILMNTFSRKRVSIHTEWVVTIVTLLEMGGAKQQF